jgi:peptidoglycan/LPS O-acetylase OafA/YrhL
MSLWPFNRAIPARARAVAGLMSSKGKTRIPELDGARGVAILMVVCAHYLETPVNGGWVAKTAGAMVSTAWSGVDLFFVLSGFLIGGILIDNQKSGSYFKTFYIRRICRIFPLYYLWLTLYYALSAWLPRSFPGYSASFGWELFRFPKWGYLFFLQNFYTAATGDFGPIWMSPTWSLAVEEQFYLFLPVVMWIALRGKPLRVILVSIALVPAVRVFLFLFHPSLFIGVLFPCRADSLLLGVLCAYIIRKKHCLTWLGQNLKVLYVLFFGLLAGMIYIVALSYGRPPGSVFNSLELASFGFTVVALFFSCVLLIATVARGSWIAGILRLPILRHFGMLAYGIYLTHDAIRVIMLDLVLGAGARQSPIFSRNLVGAAAFLITWLVALVSWRYFEEPIIRWGHSFRYAPGKKGDGGEVAPAQSI